MADRCLNSLANMQTPRAGALRAEASGTAQWGFRGVCIGIHRVIKTKVRASLSVALDACALELSRVVSGPCAELWQPALAKSTPAVVSRCFR